MILIRILGSSKYLAYDCSIPHFLLFSSSVCLQIVEIILLAILMKYRKYGTSVALLFCNSFMWNQGFDIQKLTINLSDGLFWFSESLSLVSRKRTPNARIACNKANTCIMHKMRTRMCLVVWTLNSQLSTGIVFENQC